MCISLVNCKTEVTFNDAISLSIFFFIPPSFIARSGPTVTYVWPLMVRVVRVSSNLAGSYRHSNLITLIGKDSVTCVVNSLVLMWELYTIIFTKEIVTAQAWRTVYIINSLLINTQPLCFA